MLTIIRHCEIRGHGEVVAEGYFELGAFPRADRGAQDILRSSAANHLVFLPSDAVGASFLTLLDGRNTQILANFVGQDVVDLGVARDGGATVLCRVVPPGMVAALSK